MTARGLTCALAAVVTAALGLPAVASAAEGDYVVVLRDTADTDAVVGGLERAQGFRASQRYGAALHRFACTCRTHSVTASSRTPRSPPSCPTCPCRPPGSRR